ncbi:hypothetical protein AVEN_175358-1 [Araneus ventricosus]|uniref:Uncharacterized protein n=1 Tax=Araneus ventricosus TaxID=182803 RepID=A0A4Y2VG46_ARAVE|nr:hypothetical protein AVEN_175358-1 [Araneus ventricosus]
MPETGPLTRSMDEKFEKLFDMIAEMKAGLEDKMEVGQEEMQCGQEEMQSGQEEMQSGQEEMQSGQEEMRSGQERLKQVRSIQEEMKSQIQAHTESQVEEIKIHVDGCIGKIEEVQCVKLKIEEVESEVQRKIEGVEEKV